MTDTKKEILDSFLMDYILVYTIDLENDHIKLYKKTDEQGTFGMVEEGVYSEFNETYTRERVPEETRDWQCQKGSIENIKNELATQPSFEISYLTNYGKWRKLTWRVLEKRGDRVVKALMCFHALQNDSAEYYLEMQAKEFSQINAHQMDMIQVLARQFQTCYYVDLEMNKFEILRMSEYMHERYKRAFETYIDFNYEKAFHYYIDRDVAPQDRERMMQICAVDNIIEQMRHNPSFGTTCLGRDAEDNLIHYSFKWVRVNDDDPTKVILGHADAEEEFKESEQARKTLEDALNQANHANEAKNAFLSNMSHDIRTPMNAIIGYTEIAQVHIEETDKVRDCLGKIMTASQHLLDLLNNILDMSRIESGRARLMEDEYRVSELMHDIWSIEETRIQKKRLNFQIDMSELKDDAVYCDKMRMRQMFLNFVSNAVKYTPAGGDIKVTIRQRKSILPGYSRYEVRIKDTGIGMSPEFVDRIFVPFERERSTTESGIEGTGLGMSVAKSILDMIGGTIRIKSEVGRGTEFILVFDLRLRVGKHGPVLSHSYDKDEGIIAPFHNRFENGGNILLVEDNQLNREIAREILEEAGFSVTEVEDGDLAVEAVMASKPGDIDLILMDIQMPTMNGYEATREIRKLKDEELSTIPIVAMTANAFEEDKQRAKESGMNGFITKPVVIDKLLSELERHF
ncbi:MAG: response regulator [Lachnospiraceae bacterium]|nr:response regulator [Lachnospiraceae bacterium]